LAHIGLKTGADQLEIAAADRILLVFSHIPAQIKSPGMVFIPAKIFSDVVRELPDGAVVLEDSDMNLLITAGKNQEFSMKLPKLKDREWKEQVSIESQNYADLPADKLYYMIDQVQFCVAHESPRNYGSVAFFHKTDMNRLRVVGTDGFRLSY